MNKRMVVHNMNLPIRMPLMPTLVLWLVLDKVNAPGWIWGAVGLLMLIVWVVWFADVFTREGVEVLKND